MVVAVRMVVVAVDGVMAAGPTALAVAGAWTAVDVRRAAEAARAAATRSRRSTHADAIERLGDTCDVVIGT